MKVINLFICLICMLLRLHGQTLERQVLANAGSNLLGGEMLISFTIGEPSISFYQDEMYFVSFGFQTADENPVKISTEISEMQNSFLDFLLFPNPVVDQIHLDVRSSSFEKVGIVISNPQGDVVVEKIGMTNETIMIPFLNFPAGTYFIKVESESGLLQTKKIISIKQ